MTERKPLSPELAELGAAIRARRRERGLTLVEVAHAADGRRVSSHSHLSNCERGLEWPSNELVDHLESVLGVPAGTYRRQLAGAKRANSERGRAKRTQRFAPPSADTSTDPYFARPIDIRLMDIYYEFVSGRIPSRWRTLTLCSPLVDGFDFVRTRHLFTGNAAASTLNLLFGAASFTPLHETATGFAERRMDLDRSVQRGETFALAYEFLFGPGTTEVQPFAIYGAERPAVAVHTFILRVKFATDALPTSIWSYQGQTAMLPEPDQPDVALPLSPDGYYELEVRDLELGRSYGLKWTWD